MTKEESLNARRYIREGLKYIYPQKKKEWEGYVKNAIQDVKWQGKDIDISLRYMKELDCNIGKSVGDNICESVIKETSISGFLFGKVVFTITNFSKNGTLFYRSLMKYKNVEIVVEDEEFLKVIDQQNEKYENELELNERKIS